MRTRVLVTGCDSNTEWQLPWWLTNTTKHVDPDKVRIVVADFGMTPSMRKRIEETREWNVHMIVDPRTGPQTDIAGWMLKPRTMMYVAERGVTVLWMDTDCEIVSNIDEIFSRVELHSDLHGTNKLHMVCDHPWTTRRPQLGRWYNSGVVGFVDKPLVLSQWATACTQGDHRGDQEALHALINGNDIMRTTMIEEMPHRYNVLRLDICDQNVPDDPLVYHWTGEEGNKHIRVLINASS